MTELASRAKREGTEGTEGTIKPVANDADNAAREQRGHRRMAWLVGVLLAAGLIASVAALVTRAVSGTDPGGEHWSDGSLGRSWDHALDVPYAHALHRDEAAVRYRLFGDLGTQVVQGCAGWLFYRDGLNPPAIADNAAFARHLGSLQQYAAGLKARGIELLVATVPDKARVETEALCGLQPDPRMTTRLHAWQQALTRAGIRQVDLLSALQAARPAFYKTDVHWNDQGAQAAANQIGAAVLPILGTRGDIQFTSKINAPAVRAGDLLTLANLDRVSDDWRPAPDYAATETIAPVHGGGLLDDGPAAEVMLAGSSFSRRSAFADRLGRQLGREVWNVSLDNGQFDRALAASWRDRAHWPKSLRVVIWEMSEDALSGAALNPADDKHG